MSNEFFYESKKIRESLRERIIERTVGVSNLRFKDIIMQRHSTSSLLKGVISYIIHEGVGGNLPEDRKLELASGIEIICSAGALLDNVIDEHEERNGRTTYLREYGKSMQLAASQYVLHQGLRILLPFMINFIQNYVDSYLIDQAVIGMIGMDIDTPETLGEQIQAIEMSNGIFHSVPFIIAATTGTEVKDKIENIGLYGHNLGCGLAVYEEIRDILGEHGRRRATEVEDGRFITPLHYASQMTDIYYKKYLGKKLTEQQYIELMQRLVQSGAITMSVNLAKSYLCHSQDALSKAVDTDSYNRLNALTESILNSLIALGGKALHNYG